MSTMIFGDHLTCTLCWLHWLQPNVCLEYKLIFILAIDAFLDSFWDFGNCIMKMMFSEKHAYNKVVDDSLI
jgi:hypothetical protein